MPLGAQAPRRAALGIEIDEGDAALRRFGEIPGEMGGEEGLADPALEQADHDRLHDRGTSAIVVRTIAQVALIMIARGPVAATANAGTDIAEQIDGEGEAAEREEKRVIGMRGEICGHDRSPWSR